MKKSFSTTLLIIASLGIGVIAGRMTQAADASGKVFELRTYTVRAEGPGSIDLLHDRFRQHTNRLFRKHGMTIVGFWQPLNTGMDRTLIYLLAYKDGAARDAAWNAFRNDAEWKDVTSKMQVGTQVESVFMNSTDYGPMK